MKIPGSIFNQENQRDKHHGEEKEIGEPKLIRKDQEGYDNEHPQGQEPRSTAVPAEKGDQHQQEPGRDEREEGHEWPVERAARQRWMCAESDDKPEDGP